MRGTFGTLTDRSRRLTRDPEQTPAAAEDAIDIATGHRRSIPCERLNRFQPGGA
jgi:hypothetical protein